MKVIPKEQIEREDRLFAAYAKALSSAAAQVLKIREESKDSTFDGSEDRIAQMSSTEYGKSDSGKAALAEMTAKAQATMAAGMNAGKATLAADLAAAVKLKVREAQMKDRKRED